jgi:pimeloyl-ACP methyl ester carboxylesterase
MGLRFLLKREVFLRRSFSVLCLAVLTLAIFACAHGGARVPGAAEKTTDPAAHETSAAALNAPAYDAELSTYAYPYPVQFIEFPSQRQTVRMAYMDVRPAKANGRTVVLLHGKNFSGAQWAPTIKLLTDAGFRVIAPDQIGFGKSSKPAAYQFSFSALARNTKDLLTHLGVHNAIVVGHSMGGMLATRFALQYPETVAKLVLVNPIGLEDWRQYTSYRTVDELFQQELKATPESIKEYQRQSYYDGQWKPEYDRLIEAQAGWTRHPDFAKVAWDSALTSEMIFTQPVVYEFSRIKVPTLLIIGTRDRTAIGKAWASKENAARMGDYKKLGKQTAKLIRGSKLVEIPQAGHLPQVEAFDVYSKALLGFM